jgi:hypothetical protein
LFLDPLDAEGTDLQACRLGLRLELDNPVPCVILEMNSSTGVAVKLVRYVQDRSIHGPLVDEIKSLLRSFSDFWFELHCATFGE